jgi:hypothetical protein
MPHVDRQSRQVGLDVGAVAIPTHQGLDREAVPYIVDTWSTTFAVQHVGGDDQAVDGLTQASTRIPVTTVAPPAQQRCTWIGVEWCGETLPQVGTQGLIGSRR